MSIIFRLKENKNCVPLRAEKADGPYHSFGMKPRQSPFRFGNIEPILITVILQISTG